MNNVAPVSEKKAHKTLRAHLRAAGKAGRGASKRRSPEHYARMVAVRKANALKRAQTENKDAAQDLATQHVVKPQ